MSRPACTFALLCLAAAAIIGCGPKPHRAMNSDVLDEVQQTRSGLDQAYDMLARIEEFERGPAMENVVSTLTNHLGAQKPIADWQPDPLVSRLPRVLRGLPPIEQLGKLEFYASDARYIEEAILMRKIGGWVVQQKLPPELETWLNEQEETLGTERRADLAAAYLLFDWTVRNIQLDALLPEPRAVAGAGGQGAANIPPALRGIPGPGYMASPWHVAMTGHGDAWQRARLFTLLARQQGIDVVMLAVSEDAEGSDVTPWACGVLLGEDLYLFDTAIGLPIPGPEGTGIATLAEVRKEGDLLRALDFDNDNLYEVSSEQVQNVHALIDASLEALSQRMLILERGLAGERQLTLSVEPSNLASRLRKSPGITDVALWAVPLEASLFEAAWRELPNFDPQLRQSLFEERMLLEQHSRISEARYKHLRGQFSSVPGEKGAKELYVEARLPDERIEALLTDTRMQEQMGLAEELARRRTPEQKQALLQTMVQRIRRSKQDCSYWLGLIHYETGNYETAVNWFDQRTLKSYGKIFWTPGAHYNLGRTYEQLNAPQLAQEQYLSIESAAKLGALIRAKRLQNAGDRDSQE